MTCRNFNITTSSENLDYGYIAWPILFAYVRRPAAARVLGRTSSR